MTENAAEGEKVLSKQEIEEKLDKTQIMADTYQACIINKLLQGTRFRLDAFDNVKKKINSTSKTNKKKASKPNKPNEYLGGMPMNASDSGQNTPGSFSSQHNDDMAHSDYDNSVGRRTSRRERKPAQKPDLGYEEPKPIKGVKLSTASKEIFRK